MIRFMLRPLYRLFFVRMFRIWERMGFHITLNHFYQPIPDTRSLKEDLWSRRSELVGLRMNEQAQVELLGEFLRFKGEYDLLPSHPNFGPVDTEILYCMIRYFKPQRVIEIGSGHSTRISARAILKNEGEGHGCELIAIDPYPDDELKGGFPGLSKLIPAKVEEVDLSEFGRLRENDILFIDSSHVLRIGGDVQYEYLEIMPRLAKGVIVHLHDIFLPMEYPRDWVLEMYRFWNEQYLLQAFLAFNDAFEVLWAGSYIHLNYPEKLERAFDSYDRGKVWPSSFWMRRKP
ncbi:class I SAM-dependent methyltransferase [Candidatus Poribacteria bacterium]|nr:class I SAM-dependent methyltransferase [Candidatus Poribacteria bacterium]